MFNYFLYNYQNDYNSINKRISQLNNAFYIIKDNFKADNQKIKKNLNNSIDILNLIEEQHLIINYLSQLYNKLQEELSFRKLIIEKKECILKQLNTKILNKFILKCHKQEIDIEQLKKKISFLKKLGKNSYSLKCSNESESLPINYIIPRNKREFNGTIEFFTTPINNNKFNYKKFISVKQNKVTYDSLDKKIINQKKSFSCENILNYNEKENVKSSNYNSSSFNKVLCKNYGKDFNNTFDNGRNSSQMKIYSSTIHLMNSSYNTIKKYENKNKLFNNIFSRERRNKKK